MQVSEVIARCAVAHGKPPSGVYCRVLSKTVRGNTTVIQSDPADDRVMKLMMEDQVPFRVAHEFLNKSESGKTRTGSILKDGILYECEYRLHG